MRANASSWRVRSAARWVDEMMRSSPCAASASTSLGESLDVGHDHHQDIVEVVRDAAGQFADRLHLLALPQLVLDVSAMRSFLDELLVDRRQLVARGHHAQALAAFVHDRECAQREDRREDDDDGDQESVGAARELLLTNIKQPLFPRHHLRDGRAHAVHHDLAVSIAHRVHCAVLISAAAQVDRLAEQGHAFGGL